MPRLVISEALNCKHQDEDHPMENLVSTVGSNRKWLSDPKKFHLSLVGTLKLASPSIITEIKIGNAGSSSIAILLSNNPHGKWSVLLMETRLRSDEECKKKENVCSVHTFSVGDFKGDTACQPWKYVQLLCYNQNRKSVAEQFGLSFVQFWGHPDKSQIVPIDLPVGAGQRHVNPFVLKSPSANGSLSRWDKMKIGSKAKCSPTSPVESKTSSVEDDVFDTCVISFLESQPVKNMGDIELRCRWEEHNERSCTLREKHRFLRLVKDYRNSSKPSGILTPHDNNRPRNPRNPWNPSNPSLSKSMKESTLNVLKPHLNDNVTAFGRDKSPVVFRSEMSMTKPIKENGVAYPMKENGVSYDDQSTKENQHPCRRPAKCTTPADSSCVSESLFASGKKTSKEARSKIWTGGRSEEEEEEEDAVSPNQSYKRKSDVIERGLSLSKKRLRDARTNGWRMSPLRNGRALSPPPRPDSPPVVDDIDKPSTSSTETIAERNIRLEIERRLAQKTPQDRVMRAPSGKVRGPYCTKGVTVRTSPSEANSPLSRLSISEDTDEESRQARRKLHFPRSNGVTSMVECPFCSSLYDSADIEQHASECSPSPRKQQPPEDDEEGDMMVSDENIGFGDKQQACPICMTFVSKDTVAAHADQCALKRYGA